MNTSKRSTASCRSYPDKRNIRFKSLPVTRILFPIEKLLCTVSHIVARNRVSLARILELVRLWPFSYDNEAGLQVVTDYEAEMYDLKDTMEEFFHSNVLARISPKFRTSCKYPSLVLFSTAVFFMPAQSPQS
jgi:hypothetical protein